MENYEQFKTKWSGSRANPDGVFGYQCVDLILEFLKECAGVASGVWGNAIDYANNPTAAFLGAVNKVTDGSKKPGDILVFKGLPGNPYGHIALRDDDLDRMLEQNGATGGGTGTGRDAIDVYRAIPYDRLLVTYRLKSFSPPAPIPLPGNGTSVMLPSSAGPWHLYHIGSSYTPSDSNAVQGILRPDLFPPGLTYKVEGYVANGSAVVITTQDFGRGVVWVKGTPAQII